MTKLTKIIYFLLFLALLVHPHFITGHVFYISRSYVQSLVTIIIFGLAYVVYKLHQRDIRHKEQEKNKIEKELKISSRKLIDSFKYIGLVNRQLPLLKNITTDLLKSPINSHKDKKSIFHNLLATAITSITRADWGTFRFISKDSGNTIKEFVYTNRRHTLLKTQMSNHQLLESSCQSAPSVEIGNICILSTSDQKSTFQCFLFFPKPKNNKDFNNELSVLQSIVDQSQLFYKYLY